MSGDKKNPSGKATDFGGLYLPGDRIPAADAVEQNTESAWALFNELNIGQETRSAETRPAALVPPDSLQARLTSGDHRYATTEAADLSHQPEAPAAPAAGGRTVSVDEAMVEARRNNRVCPLPLQWQALYDLLPSRIGANGRRQPMQPLVGAAWGGTSSLSKRMCLRDQVEWAQAHGCLDAVYFLLRNLQESEWHHMGQ
jgi:hypothetical protein